MSDQSNARSALPTVIVTAALMACALYANLPLLTTVTDYRYFPPFERHINAYDNGHLGAEYFNIAKSLVAGRGFADPFREQTGPTAWMPPVLPVIEAGLLWLADGDKDVVMAAVIFLQTFALAASGWLVLSLVPTTARLRSRIVAAAIFLLCVLVNFHLWFQFTHDCWIVLLAIDLLIVGFAWFRPLGSWSSAAGWGVFGGVGALVSPIVGFVWGVLTLAFTLHDPRLRVRFGIAAFAAILTLTPWFVRNYFVFDRLIPVKSNLAYELYQSQCLQKDGLLRTNTFRTHPIADATGSRREYKTLGEIAFLDAKREPFLEAMRADPVDFLDRVASRFLGATVWYVPMESNEEAKRPWAFWVSRLVHPLPFVGLLVLLFTAVRAPLRPVEWTVVGVYVVYLVPYVVVSYYERYAVPLLAVKALLLIWGVDRLISICYKGRIVLPPATRAEPTTSITESPRSAESVRRLPQPAVVGRRL